MRYINNYGRLVVSDELYHHGVLGQHWGVRNGPPYPLSPGAHSASEKKAGYKDSIGNSGSKKETKSGGRRKSQYADLDKTNVKKNFLSLLKVSKDEHFNRNKYMPIKSLPKNPQQAAKWGWDNGVASSCHQFTSKDRSNSKWVSPDGRMEAIFDKTGKLVLSPEDCGSYNLSSPINDPAGHFWNDVVPWIMWGNDPNDSTSAAQRVKTFIVDGAVDVGKKALKFNKK